MQSLGLTVLIIVAPIVLVLGIVLLVLNQVTPHIDRYLEIREAELQFKVDEMYLGLDLSALEDEIHKRIDKYLNHYVVYNFAQENRYISDAEAEEMVSSITRSVYMHLSKPYELYMKLDDRIEYGEDLVSYINGVVKERVLLFLVDNNSPN